MILINQLGASFFLLIMAYSLSDAVSDEYHAYFIEAFGTGFVVFIIFMVTSSKYTIPDTLVPPIVAIALGSMVAILRPLTG